MPENKLQQLFRDLQQSGSIITLDGNLLGDKWSQYLDRYWNEASITLEEATVEAPAGGRLALAGSITLPGASLPCPARGHLQVDAGGQVDVSLTLTLELATAGLYQLMGIWGCGRLEEVIGDGATLMLSTPDFTVPADGGISGSPLTLEMLADANPPAGAPSLEIPVNPLRLVTDNPLAALFGEDALRCRGVFAYVEGQPAFFLSGDRSANIELPHQSLAGTLLLLSHPTGEADYLRPSLGLGTQITMDDASLSLQGLLPSGGGPFVLDGQFQGVALPGVDDLLELVDAGDLAAGIPSGILPDSQVALRRLTLSLSHQPLNVNRLSFTLGAGDIALVPNTSLGELKEVALTVEVLEPFAAGRQLNAAVTALVEALDVDFTVAATAPDFTFTGAIEPGAVIAIDEVTGSLLAPLGLSWPEGLPAFDITRASLQLNGDSGALFLSMGGEASVTLDLGGTELHLDDIELRLSHLGSGAVRPFEFTFGLTASIAGLQLALTAAMPAGAEGWQFTGRFDLAEPLNLVDLANKLLPAGFDIPTEFLDFAVNFGSVALDLEGPAFGLELGLAATIGFGPLGSLGTELFTFEAARPAPRQAVEWRFGIAGYLDLQELPKVSGLLEAVKSSNETSLTFIADEETEGLSLPLPLPVTRDVEPGIDLRLGQVSIGKETGGGWAFSISTIATFRGLPQIIDEVVPDTTEATLEVGAGNFSLMITPLTERATILLPSFPAGDQTVQLGTLAVGISSFELKKERRDFSLGVRFAFGLPAGLNSIFGMEDDGTPRVRFFRTYLPEEPESSMIELALSAGNQGISVQLLTPPLTGITPETGPDGKPWWHIDMGDVGAARIRVPELAFDPGRQSFRLSAGFQIIDHLQLPLGLVRNLFRAIKLDQVAELIPEGIPLQGISLVDEQNKLRPEEVRRVFGNAIPPEIMDALNEIAGRLNRTPERFRSLLRIEAPKSLVFDLDIGVSGSVRFKLGVLPGDPALRLITMGVAAPLPVPTITAIELRSIGFAEMLAGQLIGVEVDATIDQFDLLTLGAAVALPAADLKLLPDTTKLHRIIEIRNLFCIIPYQTKVPVPIPVFYDRLGIDYAGLEGVTMQSAIEFPMPTFDLVELAGILDDLIQFFSDRDFLLDPNKDIIAVDLRYTIDASFITLPKYMSGITLGKRSTIVSISLYQSLAHLLNWLKTFRIENLVTAFPLEHRVGTAAFRFFSLEMDTTWAVTTPREFNEVAYRYLQVADREQQQVMKVLPRQISSDGKGLVILLKGGAQIARIAGFQATFGLLTTNTEGFGSGFRLSGNLSSLLHLNMGGNIFVNPHQKPAFNLNGDIDLRILGTPILRGRLQASDYGLKVSGMIDLFPHTNSLQAKGTVEGEISDRDFRIAGAVSLKVGQVDIIRNGSALITKDEVSIGGTFLGQSATFRSQIKDNQLAISSSINVGFGINTRLPGPVKVAGVKVGDNLLLQTSVSAGHTATISNNGYQGSGNAGFSFYGQSFNVNYNLSVAPARIEDIRDAVTQAIQQDLEKVFKKAFNTVEKWLEAIKTKVIPFARASAIDLARVMLHVYRTGIKKAAKLLKELGYKVFEIGKALKSIFTHSATEAAQALKYAGFGAIEIATALKGTFTNSVNTAVKILFDLGFSALDVGHAIKGTFTNSYLEAGKALKAAGYGMEEVARVLRIVFGATVFQVAGFLKDVWRSADTAVFHVLKAIGFSASEIAKAMADIFGGSWIPHVKLPHLKHVKAPHIKLPHVKHIKFW